MTEQNFSSIWAANTSYTAFVPYATASTGYPTTVGNFYPDAYDGTTYMVSEGLQLMYSTDLANWYPTGSLPVGSAQNYAVGYVDGIGFGCLLNDSEENNPGDQSVAISTDAGSTWSTPVLVFESNANPQIYFTATSDAFVITDIYYNLFYSYDGTTWQTGTPPGGATDQTNLAFYATGNGTELVEWVQSDVNAWTDTDVFSCTDYNTWTYMPQSFPLGDSAGGNQLFDPPQYVQGSIEQYGEPFYVTIHSSYSLPEGYVMFVGINSLAGGGEFDYEGFLWQPPDPSGINSFAARPTPGSSYPSGGYPSTDFIYAQSLINTDIGTYLGLFGDMASGAFSPEGGTFQTNLLPAGIENNIHIDDPYANLLWLPDKKIWLVEVSGIAPAPTQAVGWTVGAVHM